MHKIRRRINIEYALVQAFFWMGFCVAIKHATVFLQYRGYSNAQLGIIVAVGNIISLITSQKLAVLLDNSKKISIFQCIAMLLSAQLVLLVFLMWIPGASSIVALCYCFFIAVVTMVAPLISQMCFVLEGRCGHINFGVARGVGSLAFAIFAVILGNLVEKLSPSILPLAGILCIGLQALLLAIVSTEHRKLAPDERLGTSSREHHESSLVEFIRSNKRFSVMMIGLMLIYFSHNTVSNFMINIVENVGGDIADTGTLLGFIALCELPAMFLYDRISQRYKCAKLVVFAAVMMSVKAIATMLASSVAALYWVHLLQGLSYAVLCPACVHYVDKYLPKEDANKGQALLFGMDTLGCVSAGLFSGILFDVCGVGITLFAASCISVIGTVVFNSFSRLKEA